MVTMREQVVEIFDQLSEQEQVLVLELVKRLAPDDVATEDDLKAHEEAMEDYRRGETVRHEDIDWS